MLVIVSVKDVMFGKFESSINCDPAKVNLDKIWIREC